MQNDPNTKTAKALGQRQLVKPNPKVFTLYTSTVLDTHKARPPYKIFAVLGTALVVVVACSFYTYRSVRHFTEEPIATVDVQHKASGPGKRLWFRVVGEGQSDLDRAEFETPNPRKFAHGAGL